MKNVDTKLNEKLKAVSCKLQASLSIPFKKLVPGLVLLSFVLSGILAPVSLVNNSSYRDIGKLNIARGETIAEIQARRTEEQRKTAATVIPGEAAVSSVPGTGAPPINSALRTITVNQGPASTDPFTCSVSGFKGCIVGFFHLIFQAAAYVLELTGRLFDITAAFTLSKNILDSSFAKDGWAVTRDLANMFFIFILLYIAIATILEIAAYNAKALLARLIIVALLLNFSLFFTRVIIDASNILALAFYNGIYASETYQRGGEKFEASSFVTGLSVTPKGISVGLVSSFDPQKLFGVTNENATEIGKFVKDNYGKLIFVFLFGTAILLSAAWAFFAVALLFITRVVILWFLMATAPIAFAAIILPKTRKIFEMWWGELISKSFCVAVFLFFLWLITKFADQGFLKGLIKKSGGVVGGDPNGYLVTLTLILLNFLIIFILIIAAKQQTQKMCGAVAGFSMNMVSGLGTKAAGFLAGGVGGRLLRGTLGGAAFDLAESRKEKWGSGNILQRLALQGARRVGGASFDVRGTKLGGMAELGKDAGKGGYKGAIDKRVREDVAWAKSFGEGEEADKAREKFAQRIKGQNPLSRMITGRGLLSKVEPEKAVKAIGKMVYASEKAREEEAELKEMRNGVLEKQPAEVKDEKGNVIYAYRNMNDIEADVKSNKLSLKDSEKIIKEATDSFARNLNEKLMDAKADLKGFEMHKNPQGAIRSTRAIETLTKELRSVEKMNKLEDRKERRTERTIDKQEREQKPASGGSGTSSGGGTKTP